MTLRTEQNTPTGWPRLFSFDFFRVRTKDRERSRSIASPGTDPPPPHHLVCSSTIASRRCGSGSWRSRARRSIIIQPPGRAYDRDVEDRPNVRVVKPWLPFSIFKSVRERFRRSVGSGCSNCRLLTSRIAPRALRRFAAGFRAKALRFHIAGEGDPTPLAGRRCGRRDGIAGVIRDTKMRP